MTAEQLGNILVSVNIVDAAAIDDPEGYDDCRTLRHLETIIADLKAEFVAETIPQNCIAMLRMPTPIGLLMKVGNALSVCGIKAVIRQEGNWLIFTAEGDYP